jgi:hypothetical protein
LIGLWSVTASLDNDGLSGELFVFAVAWVFIVLAVLSFGWVEDLAAGRRPRMNPWPRTSPGAAVPRGSHAVVDAPRNSDRTLVGPGLLDLAEDPAATRPMLLPVLAHTPAPATVPPTALPRVALLGLAGVVVGGGCVFFLRGPSVTELSLPHTVPAVTVSPSAPPATAETSTSAGTPSRAGAVRSVAPRQATRSRTATGAAAGAASKNSMPVKVGLATAGPTTSPIAAPPDPTRTAGQTSTDTSTAPTSSTDPAPSTSASSTSP